MLFFLEHFLIMVSFKNSPPREKVLYGSISAVNFKLSVIKIYAKQTLTFQS